VAQVVQALVFREELLEMGVLVVVVGHLGLPDNQALTPVVVVVPPVLIL
jgi:hypothetical protein